MDKIERFVREVIKIDTLREKPGLNIEKMKNVINRLSEMEINDAIDDILFHLSGFIEKGMLSNEEVSKILQLICNLNKEKYKDIDDLSERMKYVKSMNLGHLETSIEENHRLVMEVFDEFNKLLGERFDAYYVGGAMSYIGTGQQLERYHSDLDLRINQEQLMLLYETISKSDDFTFENMLNENRGSHHEFMIKYKHSPVKIGLYLFRRTQNNNIVFENYYYSDKNGIKTLMVDEEYRTDELSQILPEKIKKEHNGIPFYMCSLEENYIFKMNSTRPKDLHDNQLIEDFIDIDIINAAKQLKVPMSHLIEENDATNSIVAQIDDITKKKTFTKEQIKEGMRVTSDKKKIISPSDTLKHALESGITTEDVNNSRNMEEQSKTGEKTHGDE